MFNDWMMRRMMSAPAGSGPSNIIYELYNHTCDGTAATAINTGIYLFDATAYPDGWTIELEFSFTQYVSLGSVLRCRNAASPYNGFSVRDQSANANALQVQINSVNFTIARTIGDRLSVTFDYSPPTCTATARNITTSGATSTTNDNMSGKTVNPPLLIGGENNDDSASFTWKSGRFGKCTIHSLVITKKTS